MPYWTQDTPRPGSDDAAGEALLVIHAQQGDQMAFEALYERYNTPICRYLSRMVGNDGVGCELTQETFLKAWRALTGLRAPERFASWLYRIATNCAFTYQQRTRQLSLVPWDFPGRHGAELSIPGPEEQVEESELLKLALAQVSPTYRPCLILYVIEELPQQQIADLLKMKEASVSKYVSRGKEELRQMYQRLVQEANLPARGGRVTP